MAIPGSRFLNREFLNHDWGVYIFTCIQILIESEYSSQSYGRERVLHKIIGPTTVKSPRVRNRDTPLLKNEPNGHWERILDIISGLAT